jgi:hypothetical protein
MLIFDMSGVFKAAYTANEQKYFAMCMPWSSPKSNKSLGT